jgi:hypothetical protein
MPPVPWDAGARLAPEKLRADARVSKVAGSTAIPPSSSLAAAYRPEPIGIAGPVFACDLGFVSGGSERGGPTRLAGLEPPPRFIPPSSHLSRAVTALLYDFRSDHIPTARLPWTFVDDHECRPNGGVCLPRIGAVQ